MMIVAKILCAALCFSIAALVTAKKAPREKRLIYVLLLLPLTIGCSFVNWAIISALDFSGIAPPDTVVIEATDTKNDASKETSVFLTGLFVDGQSVPIQVTGNDIWLQEGDWFKWYSSSSSSYVSGTPQSMAVTVPAGENRCLTFLGNAWKGIGSVSCLGETQVIDFYAPEDATVQVRLPDSPAAVLRTLQAVQLAIAALLLVIELALAVWLLGGSGVSSSQAPARSSNIELLRSLAMLLIVGYHLSLHSGFNFPAETITANRLWIEFIQIGGQLGNCIFVLITGYFMIRSASSPARKLVKLWLQMATYTVVCCALFYLFGGTSFSWKALVKAFFPIIFGSRWWFARTFFILLLLSPFLNKLLHALTRTEYRAMLTIMTVCWCLVPTFTDVTIESNNLLIFMYLYALAGYIRLYPPKSSVSGKKCLLSAAAVTFATFLYVFVFDLLGREHPWFATHALHQYGMNRLPTVLIALLLLVGFLRTNISPSRLINTIASAAFGIYLIHEEPSVRPLLWKTLFRNASYADSPDLIPRTLLEVIGVFCICMLIELFRLRVLESRYKGAADRVSDRIDRRFRHFTRKEIIK